MVDVRTVGAGGGSIARINEAGLIEVGPDSAGADPGPICYGLGGLRPTISDANLILGRLDPTKLLAVPGGVDPARVRDIFQKQLGDPLKVDAEKAAAAVLQMATTRMAGATRMVSLSLGKDPRDFSLFAFGGAGPMHASALARELGIPEVLIPTRPGITNALGCLVADLRHDFVQTINCPLESVYIEQLLAIFELHAKRGRELIEKEPVFIREISVAHSLDMQFIGQTHVLNVPLQNPEVSIEIIQAAFNEVYFNRFKVDLSEIRAQIVNVTTTVTGQRSEINLDGLIDPKARGQTLGAAQAGSRDVWFDGEWHDTPIFAREVLPLGVTINGPAIIEQMDSMTLIEPYDKATVDISGNIFISVGLKQ